MVIHITIQFLISSQYIALGFLMNHCTPRFSMSLSIDVTLTFIYSIISKSSTKIKSYPVHSCQVCWSECQMRRDVLEQLLECWEGGEGGGTGGSMGYIGTSIGGGGGGGS